MVSEETPNSQKREGNRESRLWCAQFHPARVDSRCRAGPRCAFKYSKVRWQTPRKKLRNHRACGRLHRTGVDGPVGRDVHQESASWGRGGPPPAASLRTIDSAAEMYLTTYSNGYPPTLAALGPSVEVLPNGYLSKIPSCDHAGLIDAVPAYGLKGRYKFTYVGQISTANTPTLSFLAKKHGCKVPGVSAFTVTAEPFPPSQHRPRFFVDQTGVIRMSKNGPATANSPPIE